MKKRKLASALAVVMCAIMLAAVAAGCAPRHEAMELPALPETGEGMSMPTEFAMDVSCTGCHAKATEAMQQAGFTGANHASMDCTTCHNDEAGLSAAHANNFDSKAASRVAVLSKTSIDPETCFTCHGSMEELAEKTADCIVLTDNNGTVVNPHALPEGHFGDKVDCSSCHKMHSATDTATSASNSCIGCHHDSVYECGTCHAI